MSVLRDASVASALVFQNDIHSASVLKSVILIQHYYMDMASLSQSGHNSQNLLIVYINGYNELTDIQL